MVPVDFTRQAAFLMHLIAHNLGMNRQSLRRQ